MGLITRSDEGLSRPYEKILALVPVAGLLGFAALIAYFANQRDEFDCATARDGTVMPSKVAEGTVELGAGNAYLATDDGASVWVAGGCSRAAPGCWPPYMTLESLAHQRVRVGLCGTRTLFIDAGGKRLLEDRSTCSSYGRER